MAMLKFKKGLWAKLPETKVEGTIYVTTDEKAMYVDISDSERIRLGDIIRVNTFNELQPPFSNEAFYYVESSNALLKRVAVTGENNEVTYEWKQINGTQELQSALTALTGRVSALEGTVGSATSGLIKDVNDLKTTVGSATSGLVKDVADNAKDIEALQAALGLGEGDESNGTLAGSVAQLRTDLTELEKEVHGENGNGGMVATLAEHTGKITALETASAQHVTKTEAEAFAKTADIQPTLNKVDTEGTVTAAISAAVAGEKSRAEAAEQALSNEISAVKSTADNAVSTATFNQFKTENTAAIGTAKTEAVTEATGAAKTYTDGQITAEVNRADGAYAPKSLVDTVAGHTGTLTTLTGGATVVGSVAEAKKAADDAMAEAQKKTTMADVEAKNYATKTEAQGYANAKDAAIQAAANAAAAAQGDIDAWETAHANDYTNTKIDELVADAKKAGTDAQADFDAYETAHASDYTNKQIDDKITAASGSASAAQGAADAAQRDATQALADAAAAQKDIDDYIAAHKNDYTNSEIDTAVADAKKAGTDAAATANANSGEIATLKGQVATLNGNAQTVGSVDYKVAQAKSALESTIEQEINAANAMDYQKGIASQTELDNIVTPKAGDTYVVTAQFGNYYPGDLLIATGDEDEATGTISTGNLSWTHVKTGYDASLEQKLETVGDKIQLSSIAGANNGQISFVAEEGSSAKVTVANNTVTIGMEWEDFQ